MSSVPSGQYLKTGKIGHLTPLKSENYEKAKAEMTFEESKKRKTDRLEPIPITNNDSRKYF
jgi:hypothetical protein